MTYRTVLPLLWTVPLLPLLAAPARANSITTYGVIVTAIGSDGLQVQTTDKPAADAPTSGNTLFTTTGDSGGKGEGVLVMPDGSGGVTVTQFGGSSPTPLNTAAGKGAAGNAGGIPATDGGSPNDSLPPVPGDNTVKSDSPIVPTTLETVTTPPTTTVVQEDPNQPTNGGPGPTAQTPEPASLTLLLVAGLGGLGYARRRTRA